MVMIETEPTIDALKQSTILKIVREMASKIDANNKKLEEGYNNLPDTQQITSDIATLKADTANLRTKDTELQTQINDNKASIVANNANIATHTEEIEGLTKELLDELLLSKVGNGIQLRFIKEDGDYVDSNVLTTATPTTARLLPGTTDRTFKLSIDLADGTSVVTNDFVIPEGGGTEVVVTGVTIQAGTGENSFNVAIQLSDGTPITSNDWTINIPAVTIQLEQTVNGISIQGTALQKATTAQDGLMTKAQATAIVKNTSDITAVDAKVDAVDAKADNVSDTVGDHTTILNAQAQAITELQGDMNDVIATLPQAFTDMNIAETSTSVTVEMTKADGMTSISETIPSATPTTAGVMSAEDKAKLDSLRKYEQILTKEKLHLHIDNVTTISTGGEYTFAKGKQIITEDLTGVNGQGRVNKVADKIIKFFSIDGRFPQYYQYSEDTTQSVSNCNLVKTSYINNIIMEYIQETFGDIIANYEGSYTVGFVFGNDENDWYIKRNYGFKFTNSGGIITIQGFGFNIAVYQQSENVSLDLYVRGIEIRDL